MGFSFRARMFADRDQLSSRQWISFMKILMQCLLWGTRITILFSSVYTPVGPFHWMFFEWCLTFIINSWFIRIKQALALIHGVCPNKFSIKDTNPLPKTCLYYFFLCELLWMPQMVSLVWWSSIYFDTYSI